MPRAINLLEIGCLILTNGSGSVLSVATDPSTFTRCVISTAFAPSTQKWPACSMRKTTASDLEKDYVSPGRDGIVVRSTERVRSLDTMRWGWPNPRGGKAVVNVRNYESPFWRLPCTIRSDAA